MKESFCFFWGGGRCLCALLLPSYPILPLIPPLIQVLFELMTGGLASHLQPFGICLLIVNKRASSIHLWSSITHTFSKYIH
jgi:hypothetical protein